jgi:hypothetical protein
MESQSQGTTDHRSREVRVGTRVRVLTLPETFLGSLPAEDAKYVREMIGGIFEVEEINEHGHAWVTKWWNRDGPNPFSHGIGLSPSEMEVVDDAG